MSIHLPNQAHKKVRSNGQKYPSPKINRLLPIMKEYEIKSRKDVSKHLKLVNLNLDSTSNENMLIKTYVKHLEFFHT